MIKGGCSVKNFVRLMALIAVMLVLISVPVHAEILTIYPSDDRSGTDDPAGGGFDSLADQTEGTLTVELNPETRAAFEFDLAAVRAAINNGASLISATLDLTRSSTLGGARIKIYGYAGNGVIELSDMQETATVVGPEWNPGYAVHYTQDMTAFINTLLGTSATHAGFLARQLVEGQTTIINSKECEDSRRWPFLEIELTDVATPIPTLSEWGMIIMSLLLAGSAVWMLRRRQIA